MADNQVRRPPDSPPGKLIDPETGRHLEALADAMHPWCSLHLRNRRAGVVYLEGYSPDEEVSRQAKEVLDAIHQHINPVVAWLLRVEEDPRPLQEWADYEGQHRPRDPGGWKMWCDAMNCLTRGRLREMNARKSLGGKTPSGDGASERPAGNSIRLVAEVWQISYGAERGHYASKDNRCIGWLARLLAAPGRAFTVADLRGDPECKIKADSLMGVEFQGDLTLLRNLDKELQDIDAIGEESNWPDHLVDKKNDLLRRVGEIKSGKRMNSTLRDEHHNIATQLRAFIRKLTNSMPALASHLKTALRMNLPHFRYDPPADTVAWET
jgi:hypothetical protein